jgi:hypothetical protein
VAGAESADAGRDNDTGSAMAELDPMLVAVEA